MSGNVYVVTGANGGLGLETVKQLIAKHRPRTNSSVPRQEGNVSMSVILACRKLDSAYAAIKLLSNHIPPDGSVRVHAMELDLANSVSIKSFAVDIMLQFPKLDCLICNAGVLVPSEQHTDGSNSTADGYEINIGVNHLGHFLLTSLLMEHLRKSESSRVIIVSSILLKSATLRMDLLRNSMKAVQSQTGSENQ